MAISAIMIDQREPDYIKAQFPDAAITLLEAGDAWVACDDGHILLIERKTTSDDFLNSLRDGRLLEQISKLVENRVTQQLNGKPQTYWPYLIITGTLSPDRNGKAYTGRETGWAWNAVQGALLTVQELGCYVVHCPLDEYANTIKMLGNRDRKEVIDILPQKEALPVDTKSVFLMGLPGIGLERARQILEWSGGNLAHALIGLTDLEIKSPVGEITRQKIRVFLGLQNNQTLELDLDHESREKLTIYEKEATNV